MGLVYTVPLPYSLSLYYHDWVSPRIWDTPKGPSLKIEKGGRWPIAVKIIQVATEEAIYTWSLIWRAWAGCTSWCWLPMGAAVARSFGNFQEVFCWPHEEPVCSPPPCCFRMGEQKQPLRNTVKAAREAVVLFSKTSVSKCLVFLKSKVFGNWGCHCICN